MFFDVIEALDEVVARPHERRWHDFHKGWDYGDYFGRPVRRCTGGKSMSCQIVLTCR